MAGARDDHEMLSVMDEQVWMMSISSQKVLPVSDNTLVLSFRLFAIFRWEETRSCLRYGIRYVCREYFDTEVH